MKLLESSTRLFTSTFAIILVSAQTLLRSAELKILTTMPQNEHKYFPKCFKLNSYKSLRAREID